MDLPAQAPDQLLNLPLLAISISTFSYTDAELYNDLAVGMNVVGGVPSLNGLVGRSVRGSTTSDSLRDGVVGRIIRVKKQIKRRKAHAFAENRCKLPLIEHEKGWLSKHTPVAQSDLENFLLPPRFCIAEQNVLQEQKYRLIGDLAKSRVNADVSVVGRYFPQDLNAFPHLRKRNGPMGSRTRFGTAS